MEEDENPLFQLANLAEARGDYSVHERTSSGTDADAAAVSAGARPPGGSILYPSSAVSDGQSASRGSKRRSNGGSGVAHAPLGPGERARPVSTCPSPDAEKRRFQCRYCDYRTAKSGDRTRHERTHTGEKPFQCRVCDFRASDVGNLRVHERRHGDVGEALSPLSNRKEVRLRPFVAAAAAAGTSDDADARNQLRSDAPFVRGDAPGFAIVCPPAPAALLSSFVDDAVGPSPPVSESSSPSHLKLIKVTPPGNGSGSVLAGSSSLQAASVASVAAAYKPPAGSAVAAALAAPLPSTSGLNFVNDARSRSRYTGKPGHGASSPAGSFLSPRAVPDSGSQAGGGAAAGATPKHRAPAVAADVAGDPAKPFRCRYCDYRTAKSGDRSRHERIHTGEKPYQCRFCDHRASDSGNLAVHERRHKIGERSLVCQRCNVECRTAQALETHECMPSGVAGSVLGSHPSAIDAQMSPVHFSAVDAMVDAGGPILSSAAAGWTRSWVDAAASPVAGCGPLFSGPSMLMNFGAPCMPGMPGVTDPAAHASGMLVPMTPSAASAAAAAAGAAATARGAPGDGSVHSHFPMMLFTTCMTPSGPVVIPLGSRFL